ncbi:MAG: permease, partial [Candidatus Eremiobacteraeota bacterium]|nr:permease [Candidatus Eremiobacteraeota bacterium]
MSYFFSHVWEALVMSAAMAWQVGWSLALGFALSALVQTVVSKEQMQRQLGGSGVREIALATVYGAVSSSCSYAAASMSRALFQKGAGLTPSLAFLFSSTNLVVELGVILYVLMGWQFTAAEWLGGILLVAILSIAVRLTYPAKLVTEARAHVERHYADNEQENESEADRSIAAKLRDPRTKTRVAQRMTMEFSMLRDDLIIGFLVAGVIAVFVPSTVWQVLFFSHSAPWVQIVLGA